MQHLMRQHQIKPAAQMVAELSELLRLSMVRMDEHEVPLQDDLVVVRHYLNIESVRFGDKLRVDFAIEDETEDSLVPNLLLQPLVQNAIKHGISLRFTPGWVRLAAKRLNSRLRLTVDDDGPEFAAKAPRPREGIGLSNTRSRLQTLYGADFRLEMASRADGGTTVLIDLPWRKKRTGAGVLEESLAT